jgi:hypothetical protein
VEDRFINKIEALSPFDVPSEPTILKGEVGEDVPMPNPGSVLLQYKLAPLAVRVELPDQKATPPGVPEPKIPPILPMYRSPFVLENTAPPVERFAIRVPPTTCNVFWGRPVPIPTLLEILAGKILVPLTVQRLEVGVLADVLSNCQFVPSKITVTG